MKLCKPIPAILAAHIFLCGCDAKKSEEVRLLESSKKVKSADILSLRNGITLAEVEKLLGGRGKHQFSARLNDGDLLCVSYSFELPHVHYYFLFRRDALVKIAVPPPREVELVPYQGVHREIEKPLDAEKRMEEVLRADQLSGDQFLVSLESALSQRTESFNVLPAFILAIPKFARAEKVIQAHYERNALLAQKFDPAKIRLGDPEDTLVLNYGPPLTLSTNEQSEAHLYQFGSNEPLRVNPAYRFSGVSVVVKNGVVTRVFSHGFFEQK